MSVVNNPTSHAFHFPDWHGLVAGRTESTDAFFTRIRAATKVAGFMIPPGTSTITSAQLAAIQAHGVTAKWFNAASGHGEGLVLVTP